MDYHQVIQNKNKTLTSTIISILDFTTKIVFNISYKNLDYFKDLKNEPFFLIPKHQSMVDIPLTSIALKRGTGKEAFYLIKDTLPNFYEKTGGIKIKRPSDLGDISQLSKSERMKFIQEANALKKNIYGNILYNLIKEGYPVVSYIEGTRKFKESYKISVADFSGLMHVQKKLGRKIPFVPLDIDYSSLKFRASIEVKVGNPLEVENNDLESLVTHFKQEIKLFE